MNYLYLHNDSTHSSSMYNRVNSSQTRYVWWHILNSLWATLLVLLAVLLISCKNIPDTTARLDECCVVPRLTEAGCSHQPRPRSGFVGSPTRKSALARGEKAKLSPSLPSWLKPLAAPKRSLWSHPFMSANKCNMDLIFSFFCPNPSLPCVLFGWDHLGGVE